MYYNGLPCVTAAEMRAIDSLSINEFNIPVSALMENAGRALAVKLIVREASGEPVTIICGRGSNGGDGLVCLRYLQHAGYKARAFIMPPGPNGYGELVDKNIESARAAGCHLELFSEEMVETVVPKGVVLDCLLGTGASGVPAGLVASAIGLINRFCGNIYAADIPTGLDADTGIAAGVCVTARETFCIGLPKTGLVTEAGRRFAGVVTVLDIGFSQSAVDRVLCP